MRDGRFLICCGHNPSTGRGGGLSQNMNSDFCSCLFSAPAPSQQMIGLPYFPRPPGPPPQAALPTPPEVLGPFLFLVSFPGPPVPARRGGLNYSNQPVMVRFPLPPFVTNSPLAAGYPNPERKEGTEIHVARGFSCDPNGAGDDDED